MRTSRAICLLVVIGLVAVGTVLAELKLTACPGRKNHCTAKNLKINNATAYPISLVRGSNASISFELTCPHKVTKLHLKINGTIGGRDIPFPNNDRDHCKSAVHSKCPLNKGKHHVYHYSMPVLKTYPLLSVMVKYEVCDHSHKTALCFTFPAKIVDK